MEQEFIRWLQQHVLETPCAQNDLQSVMLGIGDDGAILGGSQSHRVQVTDAIVDRVHFDLREHELSAIGHKALAINLSDIAAMGAIAESALVTLVLPRDMLFPQAQELFKGIAKTAKQYGVAIVGGDTVRHDGPLMISVSATGRIEPNSKSPEGWRLDGARDGDVLVVTGPLGGSIAGRHLSFEPRLELAKAIQDRVRIHSATDISDSLSIDLGHLIGKSGVGAELECDRIPLCDDAIERSKHSGMTALAHALSDGEDFELLFSMSLADLDALHGDPSFEFDFFQIGNVTKDHVGMIIDSKTGEFIEQSGYEH